MRIYRRHNLGSFDKSSFTDSEDSAKGKDSELQSLVPFIILILLSRPISLESKQTLESHDREKTKVKPHLVYTQDSPAKKSTMNGMAKQGFTMGSMSPIETRKFCVGDGWQWLETAHPIVC